MPYHLGQMTARTETTAIALMASVDEETALLGREEAAAAALRKKNERSIVLLGYGAMAGAQLCFSLTQVLSKLLQSGDMEISFFEVVFIRMSLTVVLAAAIGPFSHTSWSHYYLGPRDARKWMCMRSVLGFMAICCNTYAVRRLPVSEVTVLIFLLPLFVMILAALFLREPITGVQIAASLVALAGVVLLAKPSEILHGHQDSARLVSISVALAGSVCASFSFLTVRKVGLSTHANTGVMYLSTFASIVSFILIALSDAPIFYPRSLYEWSITIGTGLAGFGAQILLTAGLQRAPAKSSNLMYLQLLIAPFWDYFLFAGGKGSSFFMDGWSIGGIALILVGAFTVTFRGKGRI